MAYVGDEHLDDVAPNGAAVGDFQRRDAQSLLPDFGRGRVVGAMGGATDVALVGAVDRPEARGFTLEHRHEGGDIGQMIAAMIRVVEQEQVARMNVALEEFSYRARRIRQGAHMDRHMLGLSNQAAVEIADRAGEIAARIEDLRIGGAQHRLSHLLHDGMQPMLDHRGDDGIEGHASLARWQEVFAAPPVTFLDLYDPRVHW